MRAKHPQATQKSLIRNTRDSVARSRPHQEAGRVVAVEVSVGGGRRGGERHGGEYGQVNGFGVEEVVGVGVDGG